MTALKKAVAVFSAAAMCTCGTVGQHPESYHKALDSKGVEHIMHDIPDGFHGETFVRLHMYNFLKYIFKAK